MAEDHHHHHHTQLEVKDCVDPDENVPLLKDVSNGRESKGLGGNGGDADARFGKTLRRLEFFLFVLGFQQTSAQSILASWVIFLVVGVLLPLIMLGISDCSGCQVGEIQSIEIGIIGSQAALAAAALLCISHSLRKYGARKFLFVDQDTGRGEKFITQYTQHISDSMRLLFMWLIPCFLLKAGREILRFIYVRRRSPWLSTGILFSLTLSWAYVTAIIFTASILFHLVCSLQILHLDEYGKLLEKEENVTELLQEHARLRYHLYKISHRFRVYLLAQFLIATIVQFITLVKTTELSPIITFINGGDYVVATVVQVLAIILCLNSATKISHRAQGIGALASRWHAFMTANASDGNAAWRSPNEIGHSAGVDNFGWLDFAASPSSVQLASYMSSYHKRLALVMYLQANPGGITIFGWMVDRGLINTIFFLELSLITFVLGKTVVSQGLLDGQLNSSCLSRFVCGRQLGFRLFLDRLLLLGKNQLNVAGG